MNPDIIRPEFVIDGAAFAIGFAISGGEKNVPIWKIILAEGFLAALITSVAQDPVLTQAVWMCVVGSAIRLAWEN